MFCSKCGAQIPDGASFCPKCGAPVTQNRHVAPANSVHAGHAAPVPMPAAPQAPAPKAPVRMPVAPQAQPARGSHAFVLPGALSLVTLVLGSVPWAHLNGELSQLVSYANAAGTMLGGGSFGGIPSDCGVWQFPALADVLNTVGSVASAIGAVSTTSTLSDAANFLKLFYYVWVLGMALTSVGVILGFVRGRSNALLVSGLTALALVGVGFVLIYAISSDMQQLISFPVEALACFILAIVSICKARA